MSQSTVDFMYRVIAITIAGSVAVVLSYLGYVLVFVGDGTRDELIHALSLAIAAAVSSPVILALIHQALSTLGNRQSPPISLPASISVPAASVPVTVPATVSASAPQVTSAPTSAAAAPTNGTPPALVPFPVPASATPPAPVAQS